MKFFSPQLAAMLHNRSLRRNTGLLIRYLILVGIIVLLYSIFFHVIMLHAEGQRHSWIAGPYFVLVTMSTLGFGDLVFESLIGRIYSIIVLVSGVILLLSILPFLFIRLVYLPWMEAHSKSRVPVKVSDETRNHVIICSWDYMAEGLCEKLSALSIPHVVIEPDPEKASLLFENGYPVVLADIDSSKVYERLGAKRARLVIANVSDTHNTNIALTVREIAPEVGLIAFVNHEESVDILQLAGASQVVCLQTLLGAHLAARVNAGHAQAHIFGYYHNLNLAEFPAHKTPLAGKTVRETGLRENLGLSILAIWERGRLSPARPDTMISQQSVLVIIGTEDQIAALDELMIIYDPNPNPVIVIGGGRVGRATSKALREKNIPVVIVEKDPNLHKEALKVADSVIQGDAADLKTIEKAGIAESPSVVLTTNDDAENIYLAVYCRRLNPELRIVSRITYERNVEAIHRAGADLVLSLASLGTGIAMSALHGREAVLVGEGIDLFTLTLPKYLEGKSIAESRIGAETGLNIIAIRHSGIVSDNPSADFVLQEGCEVLALGTSEQLELFNNLYRKNGRKKRASAEDR